VYRSVREFLEEWYKPEHMKLLHWIFITPSDDMFMMRSGCECCSGSHYVECLYQGVDGKNYIIKRMGFNTTNPKEIYPSNDRFVEPIKHPYVGYHEFKDFFYHQFLEHVITPRWSKSRSCDSSLNNSREGSRNGSRRNSKRECITNEIFFGEPSSI
jgi:hypothetical protein